jgi:DNA-directed RNA polymerase III subunit RPC8
MSDVIPIAPADLGKEHAHAIQDGIHSKYSDRVLHEVGLCVCLWDLLSVSEGLINAGDSRVFVDGEGWSGGASRLRADGRRAVTFRMVVFRPFKGEILQATIFRINKDGIQRKFQPRHDSTVPAVSPCLR